MLARYFKEEPYFLKKKRRPRGGKQKTFTSLSPSNADRAYTKSL
jgi:hypothetical protein